VVLNAMGVVVMQVPDVFQIIVKEKGVFTNVTSPSTKAKLRILFEVAPLGLLVSNLPPLLVQIVPSLFLASYLCDLTLAVWPSVLDVVLSLYPSFVDWFVFLLLYVRGKEGSVYIS
jgi:hypothetical protein